MPDDPASQDIRLSLARAFDRAWERYYQAGRLTVSKDIARTELAKRLVELSKEGVRDETSLALSRGETFTLAQKRRGKMTSFGAVKDARSVMDEEERQPR